VPWALFEQVTHDQPIWLGPPNIFSFRDPILVYTEFAEVVSSSEREVGASVAFF
jgi:hypothetical protein